MSNTPFVDIIPLNGSLVNANSQTTQDDNIQQCATNNNNAQYIVTQNNVNIPNFSAMSRDVAIIAELQKENALLWKANDYLQKQGVERDKENDYLQKQGIERDKEINYLKNQVDFHRTWRKDLDHVKTEIVPAGEKQTVAAIYSYIRSGDILPNVNGYYLIDTAIIASMTGASTDTVRKHIGNVADAHEDGKADRLAKYVPLFDKRIVKLPMRGKDGGFYEVQYLKPLTHIATPKDYPQIARNLRTVGGAGKGQGRPQKCQCGGDLVEKEQVLTKQVTTTCNRCKQEQVGPVIEVSKPLPVTVNHVDFAEMEPGNHVDFDLEDTGNHVDCFADEPGNQLDTATSRYVLNHVDCFADEDEQTHTHSLSCAIADDIAPGNHVDCFAHLSARAIWCVGRLEWPEDTNGNEIIGKKKSKVPYNPTRATKALSNKPETWGTLEQAQAMLKRSQSWARPFDFLMVMCDGSFTLTEKDNCIVDGVISDEAQALITKINSYTELSYSGTGPHIFTLTTIPSGLHRPEIEMYCTGRPIVWTGKHLAGTPRTIEHRQEIISAIHAEYKPVSPQREISDLDTKACVRAYLFTDETLEQVKKKMFASKNGADIQALWNGDASAYLKEDGSPDYSRADQSLCNHLAYWTDCNAEKMDTLFRQSGLYRAKWNREDYSEWTITQATTYVRRKQECKNE